MDEIRAQALRREMVKDQIEARGISDSAVLAAMRTVPRHLFIPDGLRHKAYEDAPLPIWEDVDGAVQTISQPYIVAAMTEALRVGAGDRVLEIGSGSGYQAAVLAEVVTQVYSIELLEGLADEAARRLARLCYRNVEIRQGNGARGWSEQAPFDGILVACGAPEVPADLIAQLKPRRRLVIPVGDPGQIMQLRLWEKSEDGALAHRDLMSVRFVPLVQPTSPK